MLKNVQPKSPESVIYSTILSSGVRLRTKWLTKKHIEIAASDAIAHLKRGYITKLLSAKVTSIRIGGWKT